jgi:hypothetical protein
MADKRAMDDDDEDDGEDEDGDESVHLKYRPA